MAGTALCNKLADGRLLLQHGPINLVLSLETADQRDRRAAEFVATQRFGTLLSELVSELPILKAPVSSKVAVPKGPVARRMHLAAKVFADLAFVTPMAAVAGAVADEVLACVMRHVRIDKIMVNNGGDIALHVRGERTCRVSVRNLSNQELARVQVSAMDGVGGIATSGRGGKSMTLGIADSVTVLASSAAQADVAATLIANAVDLPGHPAVRRVSARRLDETTDLGHRKVVVGCGVLEIEDVESALERGRAVAQNMVDDGHINAAALFLKSEFQTVCAVDMNADRLFHLGARSQRVNAALAMTH